jgi:PAS domain S-box-containing protein
MAKDYRELSTDLLPGDSNMNQKTRSVLIVDDSSADSELYRRYLLGNGDYDYAILEAKSGQEGLALWQQHHPNVVLLDYRLPDLDGLEFLAELRNWERSPLLPVIMVTGQGNEAIAVQAMKAGAQNYLVKGQITPERLQLAVDGAIAMVDLHNQLEQRIEREQLIRQITQKLHQTLDLDEILQTTVTEVRQFLRSDRVLIFRFQPDGSGTVIAESVGKSWMSLLSSHHEDPCLQAKYIERFSQGLVSCKSNIYDSSIDPCHAQLLDKWQVRANLVVPILQNTRLWGMLIVHHCTAPRHWQPLEIDLLKELATQVSIAIQQAELYQQTQAELAERKQAEESLRQSEEVKNRMLESSPDCIKLLDLEGRLLYMNAGGMCLMEIDDFTPFFKAEWLCFWQEEFKEAASQALDTAKAGQISVFRAFCPTAKGTPKWWEVSVSPIADARGKTEQILSVSRDISDRIRMEQYLRESEARLQLAIDATQIGVWDWDIASNNVIWTPYHEILLGYEPGNPHRSYQDWLNRVHPEDIFRVETSIKAAVTQRQDYRDEYRVIWPDGSCHWLSAVGRFAYNDRQQPVRMIGILFDITDRKQAEIEREELLEREKAARIESERANQVKDEFLAILSHELRSPLNPILGWVKLMQSRKLSETKTAEALATIERNTKLQTQLVDDLLDIAKIIRGKLDIDRHPINLASAIECAMDTVKATAIAKSISIETSLSRDLEIAGDGARIQQIISNLLNNAIKFTPEGGQINTKLERIDNWAQITVSDTGKGIHPDFLPHIFEHFRQEDASIARKYGGLGLGLAIVRQLVELHEGTIVATSLGADKGSTFTVKLPLPNVIEKPEKLDNSSQHQPNLTGIRVLAVDDDPDTREMLAFALEVYGAKAKIVKSADEVLAALESFSPHIFVSDIGMPEVDGYTLLDRIRSLPVERGGQIQAIALTAYARVGDRQKALAAGFQGHISKPIDPEQLAASIFDVVAVSYDGSR